MHVACEVEVALAVGALCDAAVVDDSWPPLPAMRMAPAMRAPAARIAAKTMTYSPRRGGGAWRGGQGGGVGALHGADCSGGRGGGEGSIRRW